jgi:hypothetical protein
MISDANVQNYYHSIKKPSCKKNRHGRKLFFKLKLENWICDLMILIES